MLQPQPMISSTNKSFSYLNGPKNSAAVILWCAAIIKPQQPGGLSHIKILAPPIDNILQWMSIYKPKEIECHVLQKHQKHFSQADGSVFTREPLYTLIKNACLSDFATQVLARTVDIAILPIDQYTKDLLCNLKSKTIPNESTNHTIC